MKRIILTGLATAGLIFGFAFHASGADINATGKLQLEHTAAAERFYYTGCNYDICLNDYISLTAGIGATPTGIGGIIGCKLFTTGWNSMFRPQVSLYYGTVEIATKELTGDNMLVTGGAVGIGLELCPWITVFHQLENGNLPESISPFQLFTYHFEVSYPFYQTPPGCLDKLSGYSPRFTLGVGIYFD